MPRVSGFELNDFDDEASRERIRPPKKNHAKADAGPTSEEALKAARKTPQAFLAWVSRAASRAPDRLPDLLEQAVVGLGEPADRLLRKAASLAVDADDARALSFLLGAGAEQTRPDGSQDLAAKAFARGASACAEAFAAAGRGAEGLWDGKAALNWALARSDESLAEQAWLSGELPGFEAQRRKALAESLPLAYLREARELRASMAAWCAQRDGRLAK